MDQRMSKQTDNAILGEGFQFLIDPNHYYVADNI